MIVYCMLLSTLLFALSGILLLWPWRRNIQSWSTVCLSLSLSFFTYLYGTWLFLTVYAQYVFMALVVVLFIVFLVRKAKHDVPEAPPVKSSLNIIVTAGILVLCILYYTGTNGKPYGSADMALPFKKGNYLVLQGGNGLPTNLFHYNNRKAVLAMDIVKLNAAGNRANCIFSKNLADYEIYGDTVYSPCDGLVTGIENSNPDNKPGIIKRGPKNTNYVIIETEKYRIFLAHFIPGSIMVSEDQRIVKGQPIARVGNSGFSLEPHLHIQVHARTDDTLPWYRENQLQIKFNGRNYLLFDEIKARD